MSQELTIRPKENKLDLSAVEKLVMQGDLSALSSEQRVIYYTKVCESVGLNPLTRPFDYITLNGKLTLYAKKDCTEQLRKLHGISIEELDDKMVDDIYIVTAKAKDKTGRIDQAKGAIALGNLKGEAKANAIMKAETKAKRRVTLSISGLGNTDESEIDSIPNAQIVNVDMTTGEIINIPPPPPKKEKSKQENPPKEPPPSSNKDKNPEPEIDPSKGFTSEQAKEMESLLEQCSEDYRQYIYDSLERKYKTKNWLETPASMFEIIKNLAIQNKLIPSE